MFKSAVYFKCNYNESGLPWGSYG